jgi:hypothetical protein
MWCRLAACARLAIGPELSGYNEVASMSSEDVKFALSVGMPSLLVLVGILINNSRFSDLNTRLSELRMDMDRRFEDMTRLIEARFQTQDEKLYRVEQVMDARLRHLEENRG